MNQQPQAKRQFVGACPSCNAPVALEVNSPQTINLPLVSMVILEHETTICPGCLKTLAMGIGQVQLAMGYFVIEQQSQSGLIVP